MIKGAAAFLLGAGGTALGLWIGGFDLTTRGFEAGMTFWLSLIVGFALAALSATKNN